MVGVAQLVRALVCGTGGRGFEPLRPPHFFDFEGIDIALSSMFMYS